MAQTIIVWLIIGCSVAYLARHFYQAWQGIAQSKGGCGSCGNCPSGKAKPLPLLPRNQGVSIHLLTLDSVKRPIRGNTDETLTNLVRSDHVQRSDPNSPR